MSSIQQDYTRMSHKCHMLFIRLLRTTQEAARCAAKHSLAPSKASTMAILSHFALYFITLKQPHLAGILILMRVIDLQRNVAQVGVCRNTPTERNVACCVQGLEQSEAVMRLGLRLAFNPKRCSLHFQLNVANPEHAEIAKKLVDMAQKVSNNSDNNKNNNNNACQLMMS